MNWFKRLFSKKQKEETIKKSIPYAMGEKSNKSRVNYRNIPRNSPNNSSNNFLDTTTEFSNTVLPFIIEEEIYNNTNNNIEIQNDEPNIEFGNGKFGGGGAGETWDNDSFNSKSDSAQQSENNFRQSDNDTASSYDSSSSDSGSYSD